MQKKIKFFLLGLLFVFPSIVKAEEDFKTAVIDVANSTGKAVVSISSLIKHKRSLGKNQNFDDYFNLSLEDNSNDFFARFFDELLGLQDFPRQGLGSGIIIDKNGYILTNEHVVLGATQIKVKIYDSREFDAKIIGLDPRSDLAVIKIEGENLPVAKLGDSDRLIPGEWVVAIGNPFGFAIENPQAVVNVGVISALHRFLPAQGPRVRGYDDLIQTDAGINPGNSGGALVNLHGEVVGINTAIIISTGIYHGLGFAIPINNAKKILKKLIKGERITYGWLGVNIQDLNEDLRNYFGTKREGVVIVKVDKASPAEASGLKEGDTILTLQNKPVRNSRELVRILSFTEVGEVIPIKILRDGKEKLVKVRLSLNPEESLVQETKMEIKEEPVKDNFFRGLKVESINESYQQRFNLKETQGVVVTEVLEYSPTYVCGLKAGDLILQVENKKIKDKADFITATKDIRGNCLIKTVRGFFVLKEK